MSADTAHRSGVLTAAGAFVESIIGLAKNRLELVSVELQEEKFRLIQIVVWIAAAVFAGLMSVIFASLTLVYLFWGTARMEVLAGLTAFYIVALVAILLRFKSYISSQPKPFSATIAELEKDRACIQPGS